MIEALMNPVSYTGVSFLAGYVVGRFLRSREDTTYDRW